MSLHRTLLRAAVLALPVLIVLLAIVGSANLLAAESLSAVEKGTLRGTGAVILIGVLTDLVLLVGLLGWQAAEHDAARSGPTDRIEE